MLALILSGGQTGADQAAWRAAKSAGIPTAGWMPRGFFTEDGPRPEFAAMYGATEMPTTSYRERTIQNVTDSQGTLWFGDADTPGAKATIHAAIRLHHDCMIVQPDKGLLPWEVAQWIEIKKIHVLNVAGNRASKVPSIGWRVERFMASVFRKLGSNGADTC